MKVRAKKKKAIKKITSAEFDAKFERGDDISPYLDFKKSTVVRRVNVDFPAWMIARLDQEAVKLNVSRQAVIKMWISDRLNPPRR
ncbi:MAG TPA: CopG family transcriptional regulator [Elusimicrobiota bacterium]|nr:CopG family transcriptional regulator [Elusimicrobiota bacterium]